MTRKQCYQRWTTENHRDNRDFSHLNRKQQSEYWNWRPTTRMMTGTGANLVRAQRG